MMIRNLILAFLINPFCLAAQSGGIAFTKGLDWQEILRSAKEENKFVFVDCFASWCGPCKEMDKNGYSNDSIGDFMNKHFISVRIQMDTTKADNAIVRASYPIAHTFQEQYNVMAYPTYLFLDPDGRIVHRGIGYLDNNAFLALAVAAMDPQMQYYTLLNKYRGENKDYASMPYLAGIASRLGQDSIVSMVAFDYIHHYLAKLPVKERWDADNLMFINKYRKELHENAPLFYLYVESRKQIDSATKTPGYANSLINYVIYTDMVSSLVNKALEEKRKPNWNKMEKVIARKYGRDYADQNVLHGRIVFYLSKKNWSKYAKYFVHQMKMVDIQSLKPGFGTTMTLNNDAFLVFKYSNNRSELKVALSWVDRALSMDAKSPDYEYLDTKANILYKLGKKEEALVLEKESGELAPHDKEIQENFQKMRNGVPTWPHG